MNEGKEAILATIAEKELFEKRATLLAEDQAEKETILFFEKWVTIAGEEALARDDLRDEDREMLTGCADRFKAGIAGLQTDAVFNPAEAFNFAKAAFVIGIHASRTVNKFLRELGALGGKTRGIQKQEKADDEWRTAALKVAKDICLEGRRIKQKDFVSEIMEKAKIVHRSREWVAITVIKWETDG